VVNLISNLNGVKNGQSINRTVKTSIQIIAILALTVFFTRGKSEEVPIVEQEQIQLHSYSDSISILLAWENPVDTEINKTTIYRSDDLASLFTLLTELYQPTDRYLDTLIQPDQRYFYYIELESVDGRILASSREHPSFSRIKSTIPNSSFTSTSTIGTWRDVELDIISLLCDNLFNENLPNCALLLKNDSLTVQQLPDIIPVDHLLNLDISLIKSKKDSLLDQYESFITKFEYRHRNHLMLTPTEWQVQSLKLKERLDVQFDYVLNLIEDFQTYSMEMPDIRISTVKRINSDSSFVEIQVLRDPTGYLEFSYNEEIVVLESPGMYAVGATIGSWIPGNWTSVNLFYNNQMMEHRIIPTKSESYSIGFFNDVIPVDKNGYRQGFINEIQYASADSLLRIEIFLPEQTDLSYRIIANDSLIWEISHFSSFENTFIDSQFILPIAADINSFWVQGYSVDISQNWLWHESVILSKEETHHQSRYPDGESWINDQELTFGRSNVETLYTKYELTVPEVFALYQNYPNPFNNGTKISFDLLQNATVTLYVSDAKGRIVETFIENTELNSGHYSYQWFGSHHASGVYFYTIYAEIDNYLPVSFSRKMIYLK